MSTYLYKIKFPQCTKRSIVGSALGRGSIFSHSGRRMWCEDRQQYVGDVGVNMDKEAWLFTISREK